MEPTVRRMAVLYADVAGSTRLYEQFGNEAARADIGACLGLLSEVVAAAAGTPSRPSATRSCACSPIPTRR